MALRISGGSTGRLGGAEAPPPPFMLSLPVFSPSIELAPDNHLIFAI